MRLSLLILPIILLSGCSLILGQETDPKILIQEISQKENGTIQENCQTKRFFEDIDKRITTKNCYNTKIILNVNLPYNQTEYNNRMVDGINSLGKYFKNQGFKENEANLSESYLLDEWNTYFKGYDNGDTKCRIVGDNNGTYISLSVVCSNKFEDQKLLQKRLLEIINGGDYPYESYKKLGGLYIDRIDKNFFHAVGSSVEMIFKRNGDDFEQIYEGNSGIPCSIVEQYNIPSYVYGECN